MLSTDCLGTQEFHTFHKITEILEDSQSQEIAFHEAALGSTLVGHQNGKVCIVLIPVYLVRLVLIFFFLSLSLNSGFSAWNTPALWLH